MGLLGALVGGTVGFILGGPIGAMVGGVLGSRVGDPSPGDMMGGRARRIIGRCPNCRKPVSFTVNEALVCPHCGVQLSPGGGAGAYGGPGSQPHGRTYDQRTAQGTAQSAFMVALISLAAKVAKADGMVRPEEVAAFDRFLKVELGMQAGERKIAAQIFNQARDSEVPASAFARQLRSIMAGQPDRLRDLVALLLKIAWADGSLDSAEESLIRSIAGDLGLGSRDYEEAKALFSRGNIDAAYALLGVTTSAGEGEIKKAYRRLAKEYHPDTLASKGLPEDFTKFANEKLQAINEAYDLIRKHRGF